ncbi:hypothetical protein ARMGADRAFT_1018847 [Armillaria gallica]|uniref:Uncharacterized protein n=1 Tax=Armillaria gallica TaxID=47427 RepID=A0A2H3CRB2_ARMGA|nr:hypothetical protein ARMGADRAFT_1018847 [Armillaria gallica]
MPWAVPLGRLLNLPNNFYLQKLLMDGLVSKDLADSRYIRAYKKHKLCRSALLESYHDVFPVSLPQPYFTIHIMPSINDSRVAHMEFDQDNNSWVEGLKFAEPGKKVYAHVRFHVAQDAIRPGFQVVRIFSPSGEELESDLPLINAYKWSRDTRPFGRGIYKAQKCDM